MKGKQEIEDLKKLYATQADENRKRYPITASMVDELRKVFGPGVTVKSTTEKPR